MFLILLPSYRFCHVFVDDMHHESSGPDSTSQLLLLTRAQTVQNHLRLEICNSRWNTFYVLVSKTLQLNSIAFPTAIRLLIVLVLVLLFVTIPKNFFQEKGRSNSFFVSPFNIPTPDAVRISASAHFGSPSPKSLDVAGEVLGRGNQHLLPCDIHAGIHHLEKLFKKSSWFYCSPCLKPKKWWTFQSRP